MMVHNYRVRREYRVLSIKISNLYIRARVEERGKDKHGTGLGLSIVKSIITAHGENIDCVSTEGVGTEFTFTLPQASYELPES